MPNSVILTTATPQMPVMDGHTAMSKISASEKAGKPQIVALTANADTVSAATTSRLLRARLK